MTTWIVAGGIGLAVLVVAAFFVVRLLVLVGDSDGAEPDAPDSEAFDSDANDGGWRLVADAR